jgi:hypothetical protein
MYNMVRHPRHSLITRLQSTVPRGAPFTLATLAAVGVTRTLAAAYVKSGWLVRVGQGVYAFPADDFTAHGAIKMLQEQVPGLHVAGRSALALQGVRHNLGNQQLMLWGDERFALPPWFLERFPAVYRFGKVFEWIANPSLHDQSITSPPEAMPGLHVSVPERAVLEMLYEVGIHQDMEEARNIFDSLRTVRTDTMADLLKCCASVKATRLFLAWARETQLLDVDALLQAHVIPVGSEKRWMTRLKDGTLLSLKPHG